MIENIFAGIGMVLQWNNYLFSFLGVTLGMIVGAIPGLTGNMAIVLFIPFTYYLGPIPAIAMLVGISKGSYFGGSIPAILFNMPGTPEAMPTTLDGYPLTKQGKSGKALKMALYASTISDTLSDLVLFFLAAPVAALALMVGPPEYTMIILFSLVIVGVAGSENVVKGLISIGIGLILACVGMDPLRGTLRFTFGYDQLMAGIELIPLLIGMLIIAETFIQLENVSQKKDISSVKRKGFFKKDLKDENPKDHIVNFKEFKRCFPAILGGVWIGSMIGMIPGIGATVAAYLGYANAKRISRYPELFGKGNLEGVAGAEAGNNAVCGPNLIPLITLGIPGNLAAALILGAFMLQGLVPGPLFMQQHAPMLYALFTVLIISNIFTFLVGNIFVRYIRYLVYIPERILYPLIMIFGVIGSYIFRSNWFDVLSMGLLGIFGYFLKKLDIPVLPLLVAFILGKIAEERMRQAITISHGNYMVFFTRPIALTFFILTILSLILFVRSKRNK